MENEKFKNCYIHIGVDKTGSTSIQHFLTTNRQALLDCGLTYPPCDFHHAILGSYFSIHSKEFIYNKEKMITDETMIKNRDDAYFKHFDTFIKNRTNKHTLVVSYEGYWALDKDCFSKMKNYFDSICTNVYIIVYLRKPISYAISALSQNIKQGRSIKEPTPHLYYDKLMLLKSLFKSNIIIRIFDKTHLKNNDVVADFFNEIGFLEEFVKIKDQTKDIYENKSLSLEAVQYGKAFIAKLLLNGVRELMSDEEFQINFGNSITQIPGSKIKLTKKEIAYIQEAAKEDILLMRKKFDVDLNEDEKQYLLPEEPTQNPKMIQTFANITADIATMQFIKIGDETGKISIKKDSLQNIKCDQQCNVQITIENQSCQDWISIEQYPLTVSIQWLTKDRVLMDKRETRVKLPVQRLLSNEKIKMDVNILSPDKKGDYILFCTLIQEQIKWFDEQKLQTFEAKISI